MLPDFSFEKKLAKQGYKFIAGVDEVGRGCFAGPVVAGCVVFDEVRTRTRWVTEAEGVPSSDRRTYVRGRRTGRASGRTRRVVINDSKKMTLRQRERAYFWIRKNAAAYGIGRASVSQINRLGIKKATEIAFRKAIKSCGKRADFLLIDAFYIPYVRTLRRKNQLPIIHGDARSISIAAASIIAKVYRDKLMERLSKKSKYRKYRWGKNKGYGTKEHQRSIKRYGITGQHRKKFVETWLKNSSFSQAR